MPHGDYRAIVVDNGSAVCRVGFAGDKAPRVALAASRARSARCDKIVGKKRDRNASNQATSAQDSAMSVKYPIVRGLVTNWDDMEQVWFHAFFNKLGVSKTEDHPVLLTEAPLNPKAHRERMVDVMFQAFEVPAMFVNISAALALFATGRTTGVVLSSGEGVTHVVPVFEGHAIANAITEVQVGGCDLTDRMCQMLAEEGFRVNTAADRAVAVDVKENYAFVASDFEAEMAALTQANPIDTMFELPDGQEISLGAARFACPEALFRPKLVGKNSPGVHVAVLQAILKCDVEIRGALFANIVLSGGSTMFKGLAERLEKEIAALAPKASNIQVIAPAERQNLVWVGGSILASIPTFQDNWITKDEYEEWGPCIVHRKCF